jgi:cation transport ATPase
MANFDKNKITYIVSVKESVKSDIPENSITVKESFPVLNLHCASCANNAQRTLNEQPEVLNATVNYTDTMAVIEYVSKITGPDKLKIALSVKAVKQLHDMGIELCMLTGDNEFVTKQIAEQVGIKNYKTGVLPMQKIDFVRQLQSEGKVVTMVGNGINDSGALAQANVSIAIGKGSDIAMNAAKITIISNDLTKVREVIQLSKQTSVQSSRIYSGHLFTHNSYPHYRRDFISA